MYSGGVAVRGNGSFLPALRPESHADRTLIATHHFRERRATREFTKARRGERFLPSFVIPNTLQEIRFHGRSRPKLTDSAEKKHIHSANRR